MQNAIVKPFMYRFVGTFSHKLCEMEHATFTEEMRITQLTDLTRVCVRAKYQVKLDINDENERISRTGYSM